MLGAFPDKEMHRKLVVICSAAWEFSSVFALESFTQQWGTTAECEV